MPPYGPPPGLPSGPPPRRGPGRTLAWLAAGLVLVLLVLGAVALIVRNDSGDDADSSGADGESSDSARQASCDAYRDVVQSSELWSAADADPDRLQEMYDAVLADITTAGDDEMKALVTDEATVVVGYYRALADWKQDTEDAVRRGEYPDTNVPTEITSQRGEITRTQSAVVEACP